MNEPLREPPTDPSNRRNHYRVDYPANDRPAFSAGSMTGDVTDCSETGVRVRLTSGQVADPTVLSGSRMTATIRFARGEMTDVEGRVVRYDGKMLVLCLDTATIPFGKIIREQWWLRSRYPWRDVR